MLLPEKTLEDYKMSMSPDRPEAEYEVYVHGLMTQDPYHLTSRDNAHDIFKFAAYPEGDVLLAGKGLSKKIASAGGSSGGGGGGGSSGGGGGSGGGNPTGPSGSGGSGARGIASVDQAETSGAKEATINEYGEWVPAKKTELRPLDSAAITLPNRPSNNTGSGSRARKPARVSSYNQIQRTNTGPAVQVSRGDSSYVKAQEESLKVRSIFDNDSNESNSKTVSKTSDTKSAKAKTTSSRRSRGVRSLSSRTKKTTSGGETAAVVGLPDAPVRSAMTLAETRVAASMVTKLRPKALGDVQVRAVEVSIGDAPRGELETGGTKTFSNSSMGAKYCHDIRKTIVEASKQSTFCGPEVIKFNSCESKFEESVLVKCEALFKDKFPKEKNTAWADKTGLESSVEKCITRFESLAQAYQPHEASMNAGMTENESLVSSFYKDFHYKQVSKFFRKAVSQLESGKIVKLSSFYCTTEPERARDRQSAIALLSLHLGKQKSVVVRDCKKLVDTELSKIVDFEKKGARARVGKFSSQIKNFAALSPDTKNSSSGKGVYVKARKLFQDLKLYMYGESFQAFKSLLVSKKHSVPRLKFGAYG